MNEGRKNLFDFATKELSQDAFLRWLLENFRDEEIGKAAKALLAAFVAKFAGRTLDVAEIVDVKTEGQKERLDVVAEVYVGQERKLHLFLIEDKIASKAHDDQLKRYPSKVHCDEGSLYPIYYKTGWMDKKEREEVEKSGLWKAFGTEEAFAALGGFADAKNDILSDYVSHLGSIVRARENVASRPCAEWNFEEWRTYFRKELQPRIQNEVCPKISFSDWVYRGRYISFLSYFPFRLEGQSQPLIEFIFRPGAYIRASLRFSSYVDERKDKTGWENSLLKENTKTAVFHDLQSGGMPSFKRHWTKQGVASLKTMLKKGDREILTERIVEIAKEAQGYFSSVWGEFSLEEA